MNDEEDMKYIKVPKPILDDKTLSNTTKIFIGYIKGLSNKKGYCYASNQYLSSLMNVSERTISSLIAKLKEKKYIKTEIDKSIRKIYLEINF